MRPLFSLPLAACLWLLPLSAVTQADPVTPGVFRPAAASKLEHYFQWQKFTFQAVAANRFDPPMASWIYAMLAVGHERVVLELEKHPSYSVTSALSGASMAFLPALFPLDLPSMEKIVDGGDEKAFALGQKVMLELMEERKDDGSQNFVVGNPPDRPHVWQSLQRPVEPALRPLWGEVTPWFLKSGDQFPVEPPPDFDSDEFKAQVAAVRRASDNRTEDDLVLVYKWAYGDGTLTPGGFWLQHAGDLMQGKGLGFKSSVRAMSFLARVLVDATIACWHTKFEHWTMRPSQADRDIIPVTFLRVPNFPAYVSGHSTLSAAAAGALSHLFPEHREQLRAMASEASQSRVLAGFHYPMDCEAGLVLGYEVARESIRVWTRKETPER